MKKFSIYIGLTLSVVFLAVCLTYYLTRKIIENKRVKGPLVTTWSPPTCGSDDLTTLRIFKTYSLTADSLANELAIAEMRTYLNSLKISGDSLNGVHVVMTDDMPYKYYLKSAEIFNELRPRTFFAIDNNFYAISKSKFQLRKDSILQAEYDRTGIDLSPY